MRRFLLQVSIIFLLAIGILTVISMVTEIGLKETKHDNFIVWNDIYGGNVNADLLIMGSSRAWTHVSPKILDSSFKTNSYNLGVNGHNIVMQNCIYKVYLENNTAPKYIIHCLDFITLGMQKELYNLEQTLPYMDDTIVSNTARKYTGYKYYDYYNPVTKYFSRTEMIKTGINEFFNLYNYTSSKYKGYSGKDKEWDGLFQKFLEKDGGILHATIEKSTYDEFDSYLNYNKQNNIIVFLVYPPELKEAQVYIENRKALFREYKFFADKYNLIFIDYSDDPFCYDRKYFYNSTHLNKAGAELFSLKLAKDLEKYIIPIDTTQGN